MLPVQNFLSINYDASSGAYFLSLSTGLFLYQYSECNCNNFGI